MNPDEKWFIMEWPCDGDPEVVVWFDKLEEAEKTYQEYVAAGGGNSELFLCEVKKVTETEQ